MFIHSLLVSMGMVNNSVNIIYENYNGLNSMMVEWVRLKLDCSEPKFKFELRFSVVIDKKPRKPWHFLKIYT